MANFNKVILLGNLTRDPQLKFLPSQMPVVDIGLAVNHRYRTAQGEDREEVMFIDCTACPAPPLIRWSIAVKHASVRSFPSTGPSSKPTSA